MAAGNALSAINSIVSDAAVDSDGRKRDMYQIDEELFSQPAPSLVEDTSFFEDIPAECRNSRTLAGQSARTVGERLTGRMSMNNAKRLTGAQSSHCEAFTGITADPSCSERLDDCSSPGAETTLPSPEEEMDSLAELPVLEIRRPNKGQSNGRNTYRMRLEKLAGGYHVSPSDQVGSNAEAAEAPPVAAVPASEFLLTTPCPPPGPKGTNRPARRVSKQCVV